mmetsp:Transcript_46913/g.62081  ORF Transcript_46913/g.62081 Transcript_46913/m.62081 type:complete len:121 (+) Transcript_46913:608-970(+)
MRVDYDVYLRGEQQNKKIANRFYYEQNRISAMQTYFKEHSSNKSVDRWGESERHLAFVADMDAHFLYVPKAWIRQIILIRLATIQSNLIYDRHFTPSLSSEKYAMNRSLLAKIQVLNSRR